MRDDRERLFDMRDGIARIEKYAIRGRPVFEQDELIQSWMVRHLQIIGEAARALSQEFQRNHPDWPWAQMVGMRNILVHQYFDIDKDLVWSVVENDLPDLKNKIEVALPSLPGSLSPESPSET